jgi:hypothetical protein
MGCKAGSDDTLDPLCQVMGPSYWEPTAHDGAIASCPLRLFSTELESGLRGGRSFGFGGDLTCEGLRRRRRRDGAAAEAAGFDGGIRVGAAHGHRRLLPHLGPPVQRPLLHR